MTLYDDLGLAATATLEQISKAYKKRAKAVHPDAGGNEDDFVRINKAYMVLRDPDRRKTYDETGEYSDTVDDTTSKILSSLSEILQNILKEVPNPEQADIAAIMKKIVNNNMLILKTNKDKLHTELDKFTRLSKRFKTKNNTLIHRLLDDQIKKCHFAIRKVEIEQEFQEKLKAIVEDYSFDFDPPSFVNPVWAHFKSTS